MSYFAPIFRLLPQLVSCNCLVCDGLDVNPNGLCSRCEDELPWQVPGCPRCGIASDDSDYHNNDIAGLSLEISTSNAAAREINSISRQSGDPFLCSRCRATPPAFDQCTALFAYEDAVPDMIRRFKDRASFSDYRCLGQLLSQQFEHHYANEPLFTPDFLIPVPLHHSRLRKRGFNQSVMLARRLSQRTGIPMLPASCLRLSTQHTQRGLNARQRLENMARMFTPGPDATNVQGRKLAIVDDVVTTTATAQAMASTLKGCGAAHIHVWALARVNL